VGTEPVDYCRAIETYLCRKNDGHLIRVVGPSFDLVSQWAADGVPLNIAFAGIDRYFERYYAKGPRRRPVRIDFCDADVRDVFDEWRRAVGLPRTIEGGSDEPSAESEARARRTPSLSAHLERAALRLTNARAKGVVGEDFDPIIDGVARELDVARGAAQGLRGEARRAVIERLAALDQDMLRTVRGAMDEASLAASTREADLELAAFRGQMSPEAFDRARELTLDRILRERLGLPTLIFG
jgi:hypothetical protein